MKRLRRRGDEDDADVVEQTPALPTETVDVESEDDSQLTTKARRVSWRRAIAFGALPAAALVLASAAGVLKYQDDSVGGADPARESVRAAADGTVALLSYRPESVQKDLEAAKGRLTGSFLDTYAKLTHDVVIPGAQQKQISAVATVPAASSTSATASHAVVLLFVDQTVTIGKDAPTNTASTIRVTLDKVDNRWLISQFDPV
jgi:Mce-associated membrane protein